MTFWKMEKMERYLTFFWCLFSYTCIIVLSYAISHVHLILRGQDSSWQYSCPTCPSTLNSILTVRYIMDLRDLLSPVHWKPIQLERIKTPEWIRKAVRDSKLWVRAGPTPRALSNKCILVTSENTSIHPCDVWVSLRF